MNKFWFIALFAGLITGSLLVSAAGSQVTKLTVSYNSEHPGQLPPWVAKETGIFSKNGLDAQLIRTRPGPDIMALVSGDVAISNGGGAGVVLSSLRGSDAVIIAAGQVLSDYVLVSQSKIRSPDQLKGALFGVGALRGLSMTVAHFGLRKLGLDPKKDVSFIVVGGASERLLALQTGRIQITLLNLPTSIIAAKAGLNILTDTVELLLPLNVVATTRRFVREHPDAVRKYIKSHVEAIYLMQTDRESGVRVMAKFFKATKDLDILRLSYDQTAIDKVIPLKQFPRIEGIKTVLDIWTEEEPMASNAKPEQFLDLRFIKELDESGFIANLGQRK